MINDKEKNKTRLAVEDAADWHARIATELGHPVFPDSVEEPTNLAREIEAQQEKHQLFAKALRTLAKKTK